jgi:small-conductance mechanosensitive channel
VIALVGFSNILADLSSTYFLGLSLAAWGSLIGVLIVALGGYLLSRKVIDWMRGQGASPLGVRTAKLAVTVVAIALAGAILFITFGPIGTISGFTLSAIIGLALTMALQTTIANLIGGAILIHNRVLRLDDNVSISGVGGRVVRVGLITTWIRTADGKLVSVSNSTLLNGPLVNSSVGERLKGEF